MGLNATVISFQSFILLLNKKKKPFLAVANISPLFSWVFLETSCLFYVSVGRMTTKVEINKHLIYIDSLNQQMQHCKLYICM